MNLILKDLKWFWQEKVSPLFLAKKGVPIWAMRPNFWDECVEYYWPKKKTICIFIEGGN